MGDKNEVVVIGGGILGIALSYHLAKQKKSVLLLEKEPQIGLHSSGNNAGMIRHLSHHPQLIEWAKASIQLYPEYLKKNFFLQSGSIIAGFNMKPDNDPHFQNKELHLPTPEGRKLTNAIFTADDGIVRPKEFLQALFDCIDKDYFTINYNEKVEALTKVNDNWLIQTANGKTYNSEVVVNAAGAWFDKLLPERRAFEKKIYARHVHKTANLFNEFKDLPNVGFIWDEENKWYLKQSETNTNFFCACERILENNIEDYTPKIETEAQAKLKFDSLFNNRLYNTSNANYTLNNSWYCFRTFVKDELPIIGEDPYFKGLYYLTAFGGFGMSTSIAAAYDVAKILSGQNVNAEKYFSLQRFSC